MFYYITQGIIFGLYAAVLPGPFQAFLLSETLRAGWKRTLPAAFAPLISDIPIILAILFILSQVPAAFLDVLRIAGGAFIVYLAWGAFQTFKSRDTQTTVPDTTTSTTVLKAALMNFLNPNVYIFWGTIGGPLVLQGWDLSLWHGLSYVLAFYATMVPAIGGSIIIFGTTGKLNVGLQRAISGLLALLLLAIGGYQIWRGAMAFG